MVYLWVNQQRCGCFSSHNVFDCAIEFIGISGITSLWEKNQINKKREDLDITVITLYLNKQLSCLNTTFCNWVEEFQNFISHSIE